jgi:hypothetical protein
MTQYSSTHKWLVLGIILLFIGVAVISGISQRIVKASTDKNGVENEKINSLQLSPKRINNHQIQDTIKNLIGLLYLRHPILLMMIQKINYIRGALVYSLRDYSTEWFHGQIIEITHPLAFLLYVVLVIRFILGIQFWVDISEILDWGWTYSDVSDGW